MIKTVYRAVSPLLANWSVFEDLSAKANFAVPRAFSWRTSLLPSGILKLGQRSAVTISTIRRSMVSTIAIAAFSAGATCCS